MKKNSKGFTLVELLAVIVVLAIIMVIATQQITNVIQKNTVNAFKSSIDMVAKQAKNAYIQDMSGVGEADWLNNLESLVDYDENEYTISVGSDNKSVCITAVDGGKFQNMKKDYVNSILEKYNPQSDGSAVDSDTNLVTACKAFVD